MIDRISFQFFFNRYRRGSNFLRNCSIFFGFFSIFGTKFEIVEQTGNKTVACSQSWIAHSRYWNSILKWKFDDKEFFWFGRYDWEPFFELLENEASFRIIWSKKCALENFFSVVSELGLKTREKKRVKRRVLSVKAKGSGRN